jgi:hypothetical protein
VSDLISRSVLIDSLYSCEELKGRRAIDAVATTIREQPTVDAVEVVRCKDCESYIPRKRSCKSEYLNGCTIPNGYCFNGVRKKV